jgi:hypothetical protein
MKKCLVYKVPLSNVNIMNDNSRYIARDISIDDMENDEWLKKDKKSLLKLMESGHLGVVIFDKAKQTVAARAFIALNGKKPNHIPEVPRNVAWLHYAAVKEECRGQGLQNALTMFSIQLIRKINNKIDIYIDTEEDNIPSRINQNKLGLIEKGVYTVLKIGTQRIPFGYIQLGFWNKNRKHPALLIYRKNKSVFIVP